MEMSDNQNSILRRPSIRDVQIDRPTRAGSGVRRTQDTPRASRGSRSVGWWVLAVLLLVAASVISLPIVFSDTTLQITPVITKASFEDAVFTAVPQGSDETHTLLTYDVLEWTSSESTTLEPTGREHVDEKASGTITVYNNYTTSPQRLIKNTRFETTDGKVYRVRESIIVPGKTATAPGSLDVTVYADEAGEGYNLSEGSFTLPGLKTIPDMYTDIYAKVKTPISGGFSGERAVVSEDAKVAAAEELKSKLQETMQSEIAARLPDDTRYFEDGVTVTYADPVEREVDGKVEVSETASARVLVFNKTAFAGTIAAGVMGNPSSGNASIKEPEQLTVRLEANSDAEAPAAVRLIINGDADFIWLFDHDALTHDLMGKNRDALRTILAGYPTIKSAEAIIRPFWRSTFPDNAHDFTIKMVGVE